MTMLFSKSLFLSRPLFRKIILASGVLVAASCAVDTSDIEFVSDDEFEDLKDGGSSTGGTGGGGDGMGGMGGSPQDATCEGSELRCNGSQVEVCAGDAFVAVGGACEFACLDGQCTGVCVPGASECLSNREVRVCSDQGEWEESVCKFACTEGACGGECLPGMRQCDGKTKQLCDDTGSWTSEDTCPGNCTDGVCTGDCTVNDTQCKSNTEVITCDGAWETSPVSECTFVCIDDDCGGVCKPKTTRCSGGAQETCNSEGQWANATECSFVCVGGKCSGECVPGTTGCTADGFIQECTKQGQWQVVDKCEESGLSCHVLAEGKADCTECQPKTKRCASGYPAVESCNSEGYWEKPAECRTGLVCWAGSCEDGKELCGRSKCLLTRCPNGCLSKEARWFCDAKVGYQEASCRATCDSGSCR